MYVCVLCGEYEWYVGDVGGGDVVFVCEWMIFWVYGDELVGVCI